MNILLVLGSLLTTLTVSTAKYEPNWGSIDARPLPGWYDQAKVGIFVHWGVFAVPSFGSEWFWKNWIDSNQTKYKNFMEANYRPGFAYQDFGRDFTAEFFNPDEWAEIFSAAGAKYVVLTSKHHDGFALWPSKYAFGWNAKDVGPHRDLIGDLASAVRQYPEMKFGLYHSLYEWFNPLWLEDKKNDFQTNNFVHGKIIPEMHELIENYAPEVLWSDGEWEAPDWYWNSTAFLSWLYNESPVRDTVVTNDRWGHETLCTHGGFYTCQDRYNPGVLQPHKWENAMTIDKHSWGFRREAKFTDILTYEELIEQIVSTVSCGGNILVNVGPSKEGKIMPIYEERLRQMGKWLKVNGEAIYGSKPWTYQNETLQTGVWYTRREGYVYASVLHWPQNNLLTLHRPEVGQNNEVFILGYGGSAKVKWHTAGKGLDVMLPDVSQSSAPLPWMLKFTNITN
ncbi:alpha-L-fucosidase isoform X2 [Neocloeon triangulifer]|uniref:alpha-L-fucosidase isoform X2 n=1 Tax=Neocloeon triangulifer TaxID=2078957 RepID=UPI00286EDA64|nr:alpha-L-fucosidase isoform X2 [Neocloeon triangulifer]